MRTAWLGADRPPMIRGPNDVHARCMTRAYDPSRCLGVSDRLSNEEERCSLSS